MVQSLYLTKKERNSFEHFSQASGSEHWAAEHRAARIGLMSFGLLSFGLLSISLLSLGLLSMRLMSIVPSFFYKDILLSKTWYVIFFIYQTASLLDIFHARFTMCLTCPEWKLLVLLGCRGASRSCLTSSKLLENWGKKVQPSQKGVKGFLKEHCLI